MEWISVKAFSVWATYHNCQSNKIGYTSFLNCFSSPAYPILCLISFFAKRPRGPAEHSLPCRCVSTNTTTENLSYLCSQFPCSQSQSPGVAPGRSHPSPPVPWGLWSGGCWWQMLFHWGVRWSRYCSQPLTQRHSRRSEGLGEHWQSKWYLGDLQIIYSEGILWAVLGQKNDLPSVTKSGVSPILSSERREKNLYRKTVGARERMWHIQSKLGPSLPV